MKGIFLGTDCLFASAANSVEGLDLKTGEVKWTKFLLTNRFSYLGTHKSDVVIATFDEGGDIGVRLVSFDDEGRIVWKSDIMPAIDDVYVENRNTYVMSPNPPGSVQPMAVTVFDSETGRKRWSRDLGDAWKVYAPVEFDDYVLVATTASIHLIDASTGRLLQRVKHHSLHPVKAAFPFVIVQDDKVCSVFKIVSR